MMDTEQRELFAMGIQHAMASSSGAELDAALDALGWRDALALDPAATVATVFEQQGAAAAASSTLDVVLATAMGIEVFGVTSVVLPALGSIAAPGEAADGTLEVRGLATSALTASARAVVVSEGAHGSVAHVVDPAALSMRAITAMDPSLGLVDVTGAGIESKQSTPVEGGWDGAVASGQRALAHELIGASRTMLRLAREHAVERVQFDRPIAQFQAIRHRLADSLVAIEAADAAATAAWDDGSPLTAALAKAIAGRSSRTVARHCQQVLAGIGFTTEHDLHRYVGRVLVLDHLLGDSRSLTAALGEEMLRTGVVPSLLPL